MLLPPAGLISPAAYAKFQRLASYGRTVVEAGCDLPDLPAVLPGYHWRRHRRPRGGRATARPYPGARHRRDLALAGLPVADGRFRLRRGRLLRRRSAVRLPRGFRSSARGRACAGHQADPRFRAQPQLEPSSLVPGEPLVAPQSEARLVYLARSRARRRAAQQLDQRFRRLGVGMGRGNRSVLLSRLPEGAARPQLAPSPAAAGDDGCVALLARPRRRRVPDRRALASDQGGGLPRQSVESRLPPGDGRDAQGAAAPLGGPAG